MPRINCEKEPFDRDVRVRSTKYPASFKISVDTFPAVKVYVNSSQEIEESTNVGVVDLRLDLT